MALVILSVGVLAISALQLVARRNQLESGQRMLAVQAVHDMLERLRANSSPAALGVYISNTSPYPGHWAGRAHLANALASPGCSPAAACSAPQLAIGDLLSWERELDGAAEQGPDRQWAGGLVFPTACIAGPAGGGSGVYSVTVAWRGNVPLKEDPTVACGNDAVDAGERLYGEQDEFRRSVTVTAYVAARS